MQTHLNILGPTNGIFPEDKYFVVIHPLDDRPEQKVQSSHLPPIKMTTSVRLSLLALRSYLILMMLLLLYHVLDLAHVFRHHG